MSTQPTHFVLLARLLHWLMALMIIAMLFIGAACWCGFLPDSRRCRPICRAGRSWQPRLRMCCCTP